MPNFDAASAVTSAGGTSITLAHTCAGSDLGLTVRVSGWSNSLSDGYLTGVTYNGVAMTLEADSGFSTANDRSTVWVLPGAATGTHNIVAAFNGTGNMASAIVGRSYSEVHQTDPTGTPATAVGNNTAPTVNVTCDPTDVCLDVVAVGAVVTLTMTADAGRTQDHNSSADGETKGASDDVSPGASETMNWTSSAGSTWAIAGVALKDVVPFAVAKRHIDRRTGMARKLGRSNYAGVR
jgi:hypothetical protein